MEIAGVTKEAVEARRTCDVSYAQKNGISEEAASGALTGAFVMSTDYLKGTKEYESIVQLINSFEEESEEVGRFLMKYKGLYISQCDDKGVLREVDGVEKEYEGIYFLVYADKDYTYEIGNFVGAFGIDMENSEEGIEEYVKGEIDLYLEEFKKQQLYALINKEYHNFIDDVRQFDKDFDIIRDAEKIANMKFVHDYLTIEKPLDSETVDYLLNIVRPLETICDYLQADRTVFYEAINCTARKLFDEQIEKYVKDDSYDFDNEDDEEELEE